MPTETDMTTGLPELPEGEFWKVARRAPSMFMQFSEPEYELSICRTSSVERWQPGTWWKFYMDGRTVTELITRTLDARGIYILREGDAPEWTAKIPGARADWRTNTDLTPESIRATAQRIVDARAEDERIKSLLGNYPPKRLPSTEATK